jgi:uncharacterized membrane-anchored protein
VKKLPLIIFIFVALAQLAVPASMIWKRQRTFRDGHLWKFHTAPVDPVDAMRGRYLSLRFAAEEFARAEPLSGSNVYVTFKEDSDGFAVVDQITEERIEGQNSVPVQSYGYYEGKMRVRFPFDELWVSEADAPAAEQAYLSHSSRQLADAYVTVRVASDDAAIEQLFIAGQPLREYLRATARP